METLRDNQAHDGQGPNTWDRIKEALRRDWEQTKHEFSSNAGHELNQNISDTLKQAAGKQPIPFNDRPNPPKVIDTWENAEHAIQFGYQAANHYRERFREWSSQLDSVLANSWRERPEARDWSEVRHYVRHGFEYGRGDAARGNAQ